jgi:hypothetical protein
MKNPSVFSSEDIDGEADNDYAGFVAMSSDGNPLLLGLCFSRWQWSKLRDMFAF